MDQFDQAQELDARFREQAMAAHRQRTSNGTTSLSHCEECGNEIPEGRRLAVPGCTRCRDCQQELENGTG